MDREIWMCDPRKNTECKKTGCYLVGGPCRCTTKEEYALTLFREKIKAPNIFYERIKAPVNEVMNKNGPV